MNNKRIKKQIVFIFLGFMMLFCLASVFKYLMFTNTNTTCAIFYDVGTSRYVHYYYYTYFIEGEKFEGSLPVKQIRIKSLNDLKKMGCVKIEYSNYINAYSQVIDTNILVR